MIEVESLSKRYGDLKAVENVSFSIPTGATLALVGTSGCGKTTTLKMINRLVEPSQGRVRINGEEVMSAPPEQMRRKTGYVIQNIGLFPHFTIEENVSLVPKLLGWPSDRISKRVFELLDRLKLSPEEYLHRYPDQLSGGQKQRVGIARALAGDPPIILMDEPFGALDPITRNDIRKDFKELEELANKTVIIVTHDIEEAFAMADQVCILDQGRIQQIDTPKGLLFQPANEFVKKFLADKLLQLEFHAICLTDLFGSLPNIKEPQGKLIDIGSNTSIFEAMALLTRQSYGEYHALTHMNGQSKKYDLDDLINVFHQKLTSWKAAA